MNNDISENGLTLYYFVYMTEMCSPGNKTILVEYMKMMYRIVGRWKEEYLQNIDQTNHQEIQFMRELNEYKICHGKICQLLPNI